MANKKRIATTIGAMALTAVLAVGGTLAYLSSVTETKTNTFSSGKDISTELTETEWNENSGKDYTPGKVIKKNPQLTNESTENTDIWVAVKLDYVGSDGKLMKYDDFKKYAQVYTGTDDKLDAYNANWIKKATNADGSEIWMYKTTLAKGTSTEAIFDGVVVNAGITEEWTQEAKTTNTYKIVDGEKVLVNTETETYDPVVVYYDESGNKVDAGTLPTFEIKVTGFAVQADGLSSDAAYTELKGLANDKTDPDFV